MRKLSTSGIYVVYKLFFSSATLLTQDPRSKYLLEALITAIVSNRNLRGMRSLKISTCPTIQILRIWYKTRKLQNRYQMFHLS